MIESLFFFGGVILGSTIIIIGVKIGKSINSNDPYINITPPPQYSDEDRTPTTPYNYDTYDEYIKHTLNDEKEEELN